MPAASNRSTSAFCRAAGVVEGGKQSHQFLKFGVYGHLRMREDDTPLVMGYETTREAAQIKGDSALFLLLSTG
jgi:hypothetical protein